MRWEEKVEEQFKLLISKLPFFHRHIAEEVVARKARELAAQRGTDTVSKEDLKCAFLSEVPEVFRNYLVDLLKETELD
ncbi:MAG: hypothetical protein JSV30_02475 [Candidatus Omnitrophota bacterium]|nr:MAG: hypothetical protein JSV30_02475 [Candidatus Omnitrophota bacterium]